MKRDTKGPAPVRVRVQVRLSGILSFHFLAFCPVALCPQAFCPGFDLVYTAEIRGQPLV